MLAAAVGVLSDRQKKTPRPPLETAEEGGPLLPPAFFHKHPVENSSSSSPGTKEDVPGRNDNDGFGGNDLGRLLATMRDEINHLHGEIEEGAKKNHEVIQRVTAAVAAATAASNSKGDGGDNRYFLLYCKSLVPCPLCVSKITKGQTVQ